MTNVRTYKTFKEAEIIASRVNNNLPEHSKAEPRQINWPGGKLWVVKSKSNNLFYGLIDKYSGNCSFIEDSLIKEALV